MTTIETRPFSSTNGVRTESDVESLQYVDGNLTMILACSKDELGRVQGLKIHFTQPSGFRVLDEADLVRYWISAGFSAGSHVLEVTSDGWSAEENGLQSFDTDRREWLVVSGNACVNVFCLSEPEVAEISWKANDMTR